MGGLVGGKHWPVFALENHVNPLQNTAGRRLRSIRPGKTCRWTAAATLVLFSGSGTTNLVWVQSPADMAQSCECIDTLWL